jgi:UDP-N-acetylglucosamine--N-acetylmuramyl-(pentapeptide) pyrophosphoryl-undecaprenol N-acetylglucosamine transferase
MSEKSLKLLIAASGTGGHLFPAIALAQQLPDYQIQWLGVPDRLEQTLVPQSYPLYTIPVEGFQKPFGFNTIRILFRLISSIFQVQKLLQEKQIDVIFTTGGYIAAPTILAAKLQGIPVIFHESNYIPGKVTIWFGSLCHTVGLGFTGTAKYLPKVKTVWVGTPVRSQFLSPLPLDLPIPPDVPLIVVVGGSQGAVAINQSARQCIPAWLDAGAVVVHLTGDRDPEAKSLQHSQYFALPFYENMAALFQRANLAISRAGSGTLTELAITKTPAILIPYPYAAEDHQSYNAQVFGDAGAALVYPQAQLTAEELRNQVLELLNSPEKLAQMAERAATLAVGDSAKRLAGLVRQAH